MSVRTSFDTAERERKLNRQIYVQLSTFICLRFSQCIMISAHTIDGVICVALLIQLQKVLVNNANEPMSLSSHGYHTVG
jgi:hypothetical protein